MDVEAAGVLLTPRLGDDVEQVGEVTLVSGMSSLAAHGAPNDGDGGIPSSDLTVLRRRLREL